MVACIPATGHVTPDEPKGEKEKPARRRLHQEFKEAAEEQDQQEEIQPWTQLLRRDHNQSNALQEYAESYNNQIRAAFGGQIEGEKKETRRHIDFTTIQSST